MSAKRKNQSRFISAMEQLNGSSAEITALSLPAHCSSILNVVNCVLHKIDHQQYSRSEIAKQVALVSQYVPVSRELLPLAEDFIIYMMTRTNMLDDKQKRNLSKSISTTPVQYIVFHGGRNHYYSKIPDDIVSKKDSFLIYMNFAENEFLTNGNPAPKLGPKATEILIYLCAIHKAGSKVSFDNLYTNIWRMQGGKLKDVANNIRGITNQINNSSEPKFITQASNPAQVHEAFTLLSKII